MSGTVQEPPGIRRSWIARCLASLAECLLPGHSKRESRETLSQEFLGGLPGPIRALVTVVVVAVRALGWLLGLFVGSTDRGTSIVVQWLVNSGFSEISKLGHLIKVGSCLTVYGDPEACKPIYARANVSAPRTVETPAFEAQPRQPHSGQFADVADYIVVGTGPAGATVARALAREGRDVIMLEEGTDAPQRLSAPNSIEALRKRFRNSGMMTTVAPERFQVLQGVGVGGGSTINAAIAWRAPEDVLASWHQDPGMAEALPLARFESAYDAIEDAIDIEPTTANIWGGNSSLMALGAKKLGIVGGPTNRYMKKCVGLGRCLEGCPAGAKRSMNVTFVPEAIAAGARLYSECSVKSVEFEGSTASGVRATSHGKTIRFSARHGVILAASAIQTPILLRASGLRHALLGQRLQGHPGGGMVGVFDTPVRELLGGTQGYDSVHFRKSHGFKLESLSLPDDLMASRLPGTAHSLVDDVNKLPYSALWLAQVRCRAQGHIGGSLRFPRINFRFTREDEIALGTGLKVVGEMYFAAGAREVFPNIAGLPKRVTDPGDFASLAEGIAPKRVNMVFTHMFGTSVMGSDANASVCDTYGRVHQTDGLYVADSSLFPTNLGVNPQHTIMAVAQHVAWGILERDRHPQRVS